MIQENVAFAEIVVELRQICDELKSGTMYITSQMNRAAQIAIERGKIVFLYYSNKRGREALDLMPEIEFGRFRFQEGSVSAMRSEAVPTEEILLFLAAASGEAEQRGELATHSEVVTRAQYTGESVLTDKQQQILEESLTLYIGPMASLICEEHLTSVSGWHDAVQRLAAEIPDVAQAEKFRTEMRQLY